MKLTIDSLLLSKLPNFKIGVLEFESDIFISDELNTFIDEIEKEIEDMYTLEEVLKIPSIHEARQAYKTLGKDPSRYRLACESLYRRLVKGNGLYRINNIVDCGNVLSIKTSCSIAVLDKDKIEGDVIVKVGGSEPYEGIGRGLLNVSDIPVYYDNIGPFGSTTSDTARTSITDDTKNVLVLIISFSKESQLEEHLNLATDLFQKYTNANNIKKMIV